VFKGFISLRETSNFNRENLTALQLILLKFITDVLLNITQVPKYTFKP